MVPTCLKIAALAAAAALLMYAGFVIGNGGAGDFLEEYSPFEKTEAKQAESSRVTKKDIKALRGALLREKQRPLSALNSQTLKDELDNWNTLQGGSSAILGLTLDSLQDTAHP